MRDEIYSKSDLSGPFRFDQTVVDVFSDMIKRSVPGYEDIADLQGRMLAFHLKEGQRIYDLGCSLGHSLYALARHLTFPLDVIGVDLSEPMLKTFAGSLQKNPLPWPIELIQAPIQEVELKSCGAVLMNFTLQFIPRAERSELLKKIYDALEPGGVLLISEKIHSENSVLERLQVEVHHNFKRGNGYSALEIHKKREALEEVLLPDTVAEHLTRFENCGFTASEILYKWFNFTSFVCLKN